MASTIYQPWAVTAGEQPTTAYWNVLGNNDSSFNTGQGFNDGIIISRHLATGIQVTTAENNPYNFDVYASVNTSTSAGWAKVPLQTKNWDTGSNFDNTTNFRFIAPVTGYYHFYGAVSFFIVANSWGQSGLYINGVQFRVGNFALNAAATNHNVISVVSSSAHLNQGDYIELWDIGSGAGISIDADSAHTYFGGYLRNVT